MKRDVDLSRAILAFVEEHSPPQGGLRQRLAIEGYDYLTVAAHAELLIDEGLIDGQVLKTLGGGMDVMIIRLTHLGHDALAAIRNDTVWQKAKKSALEHAVPLTVSALVELVKAEFRTRLGIG